jgi:hypothetical protein
VSIYLSLSTINHVVIITHTHTHKWNCWLLNSFQNEKQKWNGIVCSSV